MDVYICLSGNTRIPSDRQRFWDSHTFAHGVNLSMKESEPEVLLGWMSLEDKVPYMSNKNHSSHFDPRR